MLLTGRISSDDPSPFNSPDDHVVQRARRIQTRLSWHRSPSKPSRLLMLVGQLSQQRHLKQENFGLDGATVRGDNQDWREIELCKVDNCFGDQG